MALHEYRCKQGHTFTVNESMDSPLETQCTLCGLQAVRIPSVCNNTFGFRYTEASYIRGNPMEFERNV